MTKENKKLLLTDLSARLTYGVMCSIKGHEEKYWDSNFKRYITNSIDKPVRITGVSIGKDCIELDSLGISEVYGSYNDFGGLKPYLRTMSSMTEEEKEEAKENGCIIYHDTSPKNRGLMVIASPKGIDWLNAHHFDYRGLIEKGLALEAPEGMYN